MSNIYIQDFKFSNLDTNFSLLLSKSSLLDLLILKGLVKEAITTRNTTRNKLTKEQDNTYQDPKSRVNSLTIENKKVLELYI